MHKQRFHQLYLLATGFLMGTADLIPGVSGGTIAFIAGIYQKLLDSIKTVTGETLKLAGTGKLNKSYRSVPWAFLLPLGIGILAAIFSLANLLTWLLRSYPAYVWALFFGLVLASVVIVLKRVKRWHSLAVAGFISAATLAYVITGLVPATTPTTAVMTFTSGAIAVAAMILPGISGSFILLLIGQYEHILRAAAERDMVTLGIFILGALVGLALFARVLSWLFTRYHDSAVAILAGIMFGALRKLWPWQVEGEAVMPTGGLAAGIAFFLAILGAASVWWLDRRKLVKEDAIDVKAKS